MNTIDTAVAQAPIEEAALMYRARVAILDDEPSICILLRRALERYFAVTIAGSGKELVGGVERGQFDVLVIDIMMPDENGMELAKSIRTRSNVPILLMSGLSDAETVTSGLDFGADDYVTKPFDVEVLAARIRSAVRRSRAGGAAPRRHTVIEFAGCSIDLESRVLHHATGRSLRLTERELQVMVCLSNSAPEVVSRDALSRAAWGRPWNPYARSLDVHICKLRAKLVGVGCSQRVLLNHRGVGYSRHAAVARR